MAITENYWTLHTKNEVDILAEYILTDWTDGNELTIGETRRANLHFNTLETLSVSSTYTVSSGTVEQYGDVVIQDGATLTIESNAELHTNTVTVESGGTLTRQTDSLLVEYGGLLQKLLEYGKWAGSVATIDTLNSNVKYEEQFDTSRADIDSIVIGFEPSQSLKDRDVKGIWGILTSDTDNRPRAISDVQYGIELQILGWYDEYADHTELENDLKVE